MYGRSVDFAMIERSAYIFSYNACCCLLCLSFCCCSCCCCYVGVETEKRRKIYIFNEDDDEDDDENRDCKKNYEFRLEAKRTTIEKEIFTNARTHSHNYLAPHNHNILLCINSVYIYTRFLLLLVSY